MIQVSGRFDFGLHADFRATYVDALETGAKVVVDLKQVDYMDSSALGMLLLLREHAGEDSANIELRDSNADVRSILEVANFGKLFNVV